MKYLALFPLASFFLFALHYVGLKKTLGTRAFLVNNWYFHRLLWRVYYQLLPLCCAAVTFLYLLFLQDFFRQSHVKFRLLTRLTNINKN